MKITTQNISEKEVHELYSDLIAPDIIELEKTKGKAKEKRYNILNVLKNSKSVFTGSYFHYKDMPSESEETIVEKTKLRRQKSNEIANKKKMINPTLFKEYFEYLSPSDMYKNLNKAIGSEENKAQVSVIKDKLANLMEVVKNNSTSDPKKLETETTC